MSTSFFHRVKIVKIRKFALVIFLTRIYNVK